MIGLWATCNNMGNIIGIELAALLIDAYDGKWPFLFVTISIVVFILSILLFFFFITDPSEKGF